MRFIVMTVFVVAILFSAGTAPAQQNAPTASTQTAQRQAPVGHRQPRVKDVRAEPTGDEPAKPAERELDKVLNSICRGC